jgi:hypothetical protein
MRSSGEQTDNVCTPRPPRQLSLERAQESRRFGTLFDRELAHHKAKSPLLEEKVAVRPIVSGSNTALQRIEQRLIPPVGLFLLFLSVAVSRFGRTSSKSCGHLFPEDSCYSK